VVVQLLPDASVHVVCPLMVWHSPLFILPIGGDCGLFSGGTDAVCWPALPALDGVEGLQILPGLDAAGGVGLQTLPGLGGAGGVGLQTLGGL
jgi:hypothetical protein